MIFYILQFYPAPNKFRPEPTWTVEMNGLRRIITILICCCAILLPAGVVHAQTKSWQPIKSVTGNFKAVSSHPDIEIFTAPNIIMVKVNHETEVRLFTILGKLILSQHLGPGIFQYRLDAHGIYIIKTDDSSCKIAV